MASSTISSMLFLLLLVFSLQMDEALGAHTEIRKLNETTKTRRNLESNDYKSSKMWTGGSTSKRCQSKEYRETETTYLPDDYNYDGGSSCTIQCDAANLYCYNCTKIRSGCVWFNDSPHWCHVTETCCVIVNI